MAYLPTYKMTGISGSQFDQGVNLMSTSIAPLFDAEITYSYGNYVMHDGLFYMCISKTAVTGAWDSSKWEQHRIFDNTEGIFNGGVCNYASVPVQSGTLTYSGEVQQPTFLYYDTNKMTMSGVTSGTSAGTYTATFTLKQGFVWDDESADVKSVNWTISKRIIALPTVDSGSWTYSGAIISPTFSYDSTWSTQSGTTSATEAGNYTATFSLVDITNTEWADQTTEVKSINWVINKLTIALPTIDKVTHEYTGEVIAPVFTYDTTYVTASGTTSATEGGSYTAIFTLKNKQSTEWAGGSTADYNINWVIIVYQEAILDQFTIQPSLNVKVVDSMVCSSLSITADDCSWRATSTTVHYTATLTLTYRDGRTESIEDSGTGISSTFPQNETDKPVQRTISFTYGGITKTATITQRAYSTQNYTLTLSGISDYGFEKDTSVLELDQSIYDGPYKSLNYHVNSSYAVAKIDVEGYTEFTVWINSFAESKYDYSVSSQIDASSYPTYNYDGYSENGYSTTMSSLAGLYSNTGYFQRDPSNGLDTDNWRRITYALDGNTHYIYIVYLKDSSASSNYDRGYFVVERG